MKDSMYSRGITYLLGSLILIFVTLAPSTGNATTYYVATSGNDSNPGTEFSPFQTIKKGVSSLSAGDTLYVKSGTYSESILSWETTIPNGTSWDNPVTIAANPGDTVIITPPSGHAFFWVNDGQKKYLIIDGFIVDGKNKALHGFKLSDNSRYIRVQNCEIKNSIDNNILVHICSGCANPETAPHDTFHEFINLKIHDNGSPEAPRHGIYVETGKNLLELSEVYNSSGYGAHFYRSTINSTNNNVIRYNTFHDNNTAGQWGCGIISSSGEENIVYNNIAYGNIMGFCLMYRTTDALLYNNIAYENDAHGILVSSGSASGSKVNNNTVYNNGQYGIFVGDSAQDTVLKNNISYQNGIKDFYLEPGEQTGTVTANNLTTDPLFVNAGDNDFHLQQGSLAIDQGTTISEITIDYDSITRPKGTNFDIGAYEFIQSAPLPPLAPIGLKFLP